jgi:hypothetical protein
MTGNSHSFGVQGNAGIGPDARRIPRNQKIEVTRAEM